MFNTHDLTDENALILLNEYAKIDPKAFNLIVLLQSTKDFGEKDMLLSQIHRYVQESGSHD